MLISTDKFLQRLVPFLPKAGLPVIKQNLNEAARNFFLRVPVWTADVDVAGVVDQQEYSIDLAAVGENLFPHDILSIREKDAVLDMHPSIYQWLNSRLVLDSSIVPQAGDDPIEWRVRVHVAGNMDCVLFPDELLERYSTPIIGRAFDLVAGLPGFPWSNEKMAERGAKDYRQGVQLAMIAVGSNEISG